MSTVSELKRILENLENKNLGDIEVYFSAGMDHRGNEEVFRIEDVYIDNHFPVIILDGVLIECGDINYCSKNSSKKANCHECKNAPECENAHDCDEETNEFLSLLGTDGRELVDKFWKMREGE